MAISTTKSAMVKNVRTSKNKIIMVGSTPPPYHGTTIYFKSLLKMFKIGQIKYILQRIKDYQIFPCIQQNISSVSKYNDKRIKKKSLSRLLSSLN